MVAKRIVGYMIICSHIEQLENLTDYTILRVLSFYSRSNFDPILEPLCN